MARYAAAMLAIGAGQAGPAAEALAALADPVLCLPAAPRVVTLDEAMLGPGLPALYLRLLNDDPETPLRCRALPADRLGAAQADIGRALAALGPDFAGEIAAVAGEVVLVAREPGAPLRFQGATALHLWGAVVLNAEDWDTPAAMGEALAHESGHAVLFGLTGGEPMVENPDDERFASPLRAEKRPMDGVVHATWVLARMHLAAMRMLDSGLLDAANQAEAALLRERAVRLYADGLVVVARHARFTPAGRAAFATAEHYMEAAAGIRRGG